MKKHLFRIVSLFLVIAMLITPIIGCSSDSDTPSAESSHTQTTEPTAPVTVIDQEGISVTLPSKIERVVSVYPMASLIVYSLNGQDMLVGIDSHSPNNEVLQKVDAGITDITQVGMPWEVNVETVLATNPDIVLGGFGEVRKSLENAGLPVIGLNLESPEKLKEGIELIGQCIGKDSETESLIDYYDEKMDTITSRTGDIPETDRVRVLITNKTGKASCTGGDSYQHFLIEGAGGINVAEDVTGRWPEASAEQIIVWDPEVIIVPPYCADKPEDILNDAAFRDITAVKNGRVYLMPEYTVAWDTPVADSILGELWIAQKLYPDKFDDIDIDEEADDFYTQFYGIPYIWDKTITDSLGNEVTIPKHAESIASLRAGITEIICALGAKDKILAVEDGVKGGSGYGEFITSVHPDLMEKGCPIMGRDPNLEEMLRIDPELILIGGYGRMKWVDPLNTIGLPVVIAHFETLEDYMNDIRIVAQCVDAENRAEDLIDYLGGKLDFVASKVGDVPEADKVRILYAGHDVYHIYGGETFEQAQIDAAGGINVCQTLTGWMPEVSAEQIMVWDPEVIVLLNGVSTGDVLNDSKLADVSAVKDGRVYSLPESGWDFASPRALFCIEWLASKLYPERFADVDIVGETNEFYQEVFGVNYTGPALAETRTITDMKGRLVEIPADPQSIVSVFPYVTFTLLALGGNDMLVAVDTASAENSNLATVFPGVEGKPAVGSAFNINSESVLLADPDLVLTVNWDRDPDKTQDMLQTPLLCVDLNYYKESIEFIASIIGAQDKAQEFTAYYDEKIGYIAEKMTGIAEDEKLKVYIAAGGGLLSTYGAESTWHYEIDDADGVNVGADITGGGSHDVSMEQVLVWNPDVIILDKSCPDSVSNLLSDSLWESVEAVKNGSVYRAPDGFLDTFGRPHMESALARVWLANVLYPEEMGLNIVAEAQAFYSTFYGIDLSDAEIEAILNPE